jgi:hypothetical protein
MGEEKTQMMINPKKTKQLEDFEKRCKKAENVIQLPMKI